MSTFDVSSRKRSIYASNKNLQHHHSSELRNPIQKHVSMDFISKGTLSFYHISYSVGGDQEKRRWKNWHPSLMKSEPKKQIIDEISGIFIPGMNAIMGPTGCGKSTFLDILADRIDPRGLSGQVFVDGYRPPPSFKYIVGYVVQNDVISGTLTVQENLMFSANIRLQNDFSENERRARVRQIIIDLGLESCADTIVGTKLLRGISGGERKRTCIGMELVLSPKILFLDEPTTGLDASTARNVMECLRKLSKNGRTIIFSIHQPRYSIFKLFDNILLICKGKNVYHGPALAMIDYFNTQDYFCELHDNPADFALDVLIDISQNPVYLQKLSQAYLESEVHASIDSLLRKQLRNDSLERFCRKQQGTTAARSFSTEVYYISQRTLKNVLRNPEMLLSQTLVAILLSFIEGSIFYDMKNTITSGIQDRTIAFSFIIITQLLSTETAIEPFTEERILFIHEYTSGYYRTSTFFIAKLICDILPMRIIPSIIFSLLTYFLMGLQQSNDQFFVFLITILMISLFGSGLCFLVAITIPIYPVALIIITFYHLVMVLFCGFIGTKRMPSWVSSIEWINNFRYSLNVLIMNEFRNISFCAPNRPHICPITGLTAMRRIPLDYNTEWDMWKNFFLLTMLTITLFLFAYIQLCRIKTTK